MKHSGRAFQAALKIIFWTLMAVVAIFIGGLLATLVAAAATTLSTMLVILWLLFALFTFYFFRDPNPRVPADVNLIVSPAHGKVDIIDEITEPLFMGGPCRRISIFLSVFNVHVQNAPVSGKLSFSRYSTGKFLNALKAESAEDNENLLLGIACSDRDGEKIGVRLIAGAIARRIVPYVKEGEELARGGRISLIQFGSRTDLYLPLSAKVKVQLNDKVVGGTTVLAAFE